MNTLDFPSLANFLICSLVTLSGLYWLRTLAQKYEDRPYIFRSYLFWWLSWVVWTVTWTMITFTDWEVTHRPLMLGLSDINAIFLIIVYFSLTRGNAYKPILALIDFVGLFAVIAVGYLIFHTLLPERFDHLQTGWGLCLSAVSTLVVGWAFLSLYKTRAVLIVGFVYAFSQPLAFDAILGLEPTPGVSATLAAFTFVLAFFKVLWATVTTFYFCHDPAEGEKVEGGTKRSLSLSSLMKLPMAFHAQTIILLAAIIGLLLITVIGQIPNLDKEALALTFSAFGLLLTIISLLAKAFSHLKKAA